MESKWNYMKSNENAFLLYEKKTNFMEFLSVITTTLHGIPFDYT